MTAMSSGESRRLLIGRALVHDPKTLILDEPTNSLDLHALHTFREHLRKIARSGTGIILVTHNLHDIIPEISRVVLMKDGRFCGDGPKEGMLTDTKIGDLFHVPLHVREEGGYFLCNRFLMAAVFCGVFERDLFFQLLQFPKNKRSGVFLCYRIL